MGKGSKIRPRDKKRCDKNRFDVEYDRIFNKNNKDNLLFDYEKKLSEDVQK